MKTVNDILSFLNTVAPPSLKEDWDNVGLVIGHGDRQVCRVLSLDASLDVLKEAVEKDCQLLVTHHPIIFGGLKQLNELTVTGKAALFAAENRITCVNLHTNLDSVHGGVNDILAKLLGLSNPQIVNPRGIDANGEEYGYLRVGQVEESDLRTFAVFVKEQLCCPGVRLVDAGKPVRKVAVGGGACGDEMTAAIREGCDTFVTADIKYHQFCDAVALGINLIDAGHFETEVPVCHCLQEKLRAEFPDLEILMSEKQKDPIEFV